MTIRGQQPGRPRAFDVDATLDRAVDAFHRHGHGGTTYAVLEQATGQHRQSLVYAYGDKRALFGAVLDRYAARRLAEVIACLTRTRSPAANLVAAFDLWLQDARSTERRGCLLVAAAGEIGPHDAAVAAKVDAATARLIAAFEDAFTRARRAGELRCDLAPADLARCAVALGDGALLHARNAADATLAEAGFRGFLAAVLNPDRHEAAEPASDGATQRPHT